MSRARKILELVSKQYNKDEMSNSERMKNTNLHLSPQSKFSSFPTNSLTDNVTSKNCVITEPASNELTVVENVELELIGLKSGQFLNLNNTDDVIFQYDLSDRENTILFANEDLEEDENDNVHFFLNNNINDAKNNQVGVSSEDLENFLSATKLSSESNNNSEDKISDDSDNNRPLVPYSEHSDSDDYDIPKKSKKGKKRFQVKKDTWFAEQNKRRREMGRNYLGRQKHNDKWNYDIERGSREMKQRCLCKKKPNGLIKCADISEQDRKNIFEQYWSWTWGEKKVFVDHTVKALPTTRQRDRKDPNSSRRGQSLLYYLKINDKNIRVCRTMYLNTLAIGRWTVLNWKNIMANGRQPRYCRVNKTDCVKPFEGENKQLLDFINSLPCMESHYCRATTSKMYLLPEWTSKQKLYKFYVEDWCKSKKIAALSISSFNNALNLRNIALFRPKKDECEKCTAYKLGYVSEDDYQLHLSKKNEARLEKQKDTLNESLVYTVDLQAVLMAPKSNVSSLYYKTKLCVHNLCFFNLNTKEGYCYLWNESEGGLSAEEFASCLSQFIETHVLPAIDRSKEIPKVIFYTDGCTYQNRNVVIANAAINLAITHNIVIEQKYLEVGHTQMEADSIHSTIERCVRNRKINVPADYAYICRIARQKPQPYYVKYLDHTFFKSFKKVNFLKSIRPGKKKGDPKVNDIRALRYTPEGEIYFKLRFGDQWELLPQRKDGQVKNCMWNELDDLFKERLKISAKKYSDLQELKTTLPVDYHEFYNNLPHE